MQMVESVDMETKSEKRERIKRNQSKMRVFGAGVKNLFRLKIERTVLDRRGRWVAPVHHKKRTRA